jgi:ABC-2 type transport system ATP-binding protein
VTERVRSDGRASNADPLILSVEGLSKRYGERLALSEVSFATSAGERVAVIGPNGAGKTTLLSIIAGIQQQSSGRIDRVPGEVGWVPQQSAVYSKLTVAENLELFARLEKISTPRQVVKRMLDLTGLSHRSNDLIASLSGGNRQRVNVAVGLICQPRVLLLDEPSSSLDPRQRERLWEFIEDLAEQGTGVVFSTHNVAEAERHADRVLVLADGELLFIGSPEQLAAEASRNVPSGNFEESFVAFLRERGH